MNVQSQLASAACKAQRAKFRFPREDPPVSEIIDTRSSDQKMQDILRTWSQCLNQDETDVWNQICDRDLSRDNSLKSGLRTCKSIIESEIRDFKNANKDKKSEMLQILQNIPSNNSCNEQSNLLLSNGNNSQSVDPSNNPEPTAESLLLNDPAGVSHLDPEILSSFCDPVSGSQDDPTINHCVKSDSHSIQLREMCKTQVLKLRNQCHNKIKLQTSFRKNHKLLLLHVILLRYHCELSPRLNSAYKKLLKSKKISMRIIKKFCNLLACKELINPE